MGTMIDSFIDFSDSPCHRGERYHRACHRSSEQTYRGVGEGVLVGERVGLGESGTRIGVGSSGRTGTAVGAITGGRVGTSAVAAGEGVRSRAGVRRGVRVGVSRGAVGVGER